MKTNVNVKRIYDKQTKTWFEVTPEQYAEFDQWRTNKRKREQYHGRCMCPRNKWWLCDGISSSFVKPPASPPVGSVRNSNPPTSSRRR